MTAIMSQYVQYSAKVHEGLRQHVHTVDIWIQPHLISPVCCRVTVEGLWWSNKGMYGGWQGTLAGGLDVLR